jgi:hypothetical protein
MPWSLRNKAQLGRLIFTRSNFGLELQVSNNDEATGDLEANVRNVNWMTLHPFSNEKQRKRELGNSARSPITVPNYMSAFGWIHENPGRFVKLTLSRITLLWFPRMLRVSQTLIQALIMILAICGVISLWRTDSLTTIFMSSACVAYSLVYVVIEVSPRYRFPIEGFLLVFASYFVCGTAAGASSMGRAKNETVSLSAN